MRDIISAGGSEFLLGADPVIFADDTADVSLQYVPVQLFEQWIAELDWYLKTVIDIAGMTCWYHHQ